MDWSITRLILLRTSSFVNPLCTISWGVFGIILDGYLIIEWYVAVSPGYFQTLQCTYGLSDSGEYFGLGTFFTDECTQVFEALYFIKSVSGYLHVRHAVVSFCFFIPPDPSRRMSLVFSPLISIPWCCL